MISGMQLKNYATSKTRQALIHLFVCLLDTGFIQLISLDNVNDLTGDVLVK